MDQIRELVVRMARQNRRWGYTRIRGALWNLGHDVGRTTIANILKEHGIEPAPERRKKMTWAEFLRANWSVFAAADFFTVEVLTMHGVIRYHVLLVIELWSRKVEIAGIKADPHGRWMQQIGRNLTDVVDGFLKGKRFLILDLGIHLLDVARLCLVVPAFPSGASPLSVRQRIPDSGR